MNNKPIKLVFNSEIELDAEFKRIVQKIFANYYKNILKHKPDEVIDSKFALEFVLEKYVPNWAIISNKKESVGKLCAIVATDLRMALVMFKDNLDLDPVHCMYRIEDLSLAGSFGDLIATCISDAINKRPLT